MTITREKIMDRQAPRATASAKMVDNKQIYKREIILPAHLFAAYYAVAAKSFVTDM